MANGSQMKPGSKQKNTPGGVSQKQTETNRRLANAPRIGIGTKKQAQKTLDSINFHTGVNKRAMTFKSKMCSEAGSCDIVGQRKLARDIYKMSSEKGRPEMILSGIKVGPKKRKKPKLSPGN